ncbi:MAG TPA: hypothetical protein PK637_14405 [Flavobacteriales bacterium]|nr:hypothetical protein [Flavobacteriales bacterium]HRE97958.1 hypothetical protein [Flavobacteriales bacterium]HRJ39105.1 hypothetical protein [Flavobacteriales bacterium]
MSQLKAEPRTILYFIWNHFDLLNELFVEQMEKGYIRDTSLRNIVSKYEFDVRDKLSEYKILRSINDDFEIRPVIFQLIEFVQNEFKPVLPETIEKYGFSILSLFRKIKEGINGDKEILIKRIEDLLSEVRLFVDSIEKNTTKLLSETRALKSNLEKIDYREKVHRASGWIEHYIIPLNEILDVNQTTSVTNQLHEVAYYVNIKRLDTTDELIRGQFEKLYSFLVQTNDDLIRQSKLLTNELLPLIERIKTESVILTGWIEFLKKPYTARVPKVFKTTMERAYNRSFYLNAKEYVEQFMDDEPVYFSDEPSFQEKWIFNRELYRVRMESQLPIDDFFGWCQNTVKKDFHLIDQEKFFSMVTLIFEDDLIMEADEKAEYTTIKASDVIMKVPKVKIDRHGIS